MLPKLIDTGRFYLPSYGVFVAAAFLAALWVTRRLAARRGLAPDRITDLAVYCAIAGILGGKLGMFLFDWRFYLENPARIFSLETLQAMGVYQTGLILALLTAFWYMRRHRMPFLPTADLFAPGLALGHGIGRLGCFAAGCCWGRQCDRPWAVTFTNPDAQQLTGVPLFVPLHPTQLYEAAAEFLLFAFLWRRFHQPHREGEILSYYLIFYSLARFVIEFFRHHEQGLYFELSLTQWIALGLFSLGIWRWMRKPAVAPAH